MCVCSRMCGLCLLSRLSLAPTSILPQHQQQRQQQPEKQPHGTRNRRRLRVIVACELQEMDMWMGWASRGWCSRRRKANESFGQQTRVRWACLSMWTSFSKCYANFENFRNCAKDYQDFYTKFENNFLLSVTLRKLDKKKIYSYFWSISTGRVMECAARQLTKEHRWKSSSHQPEVHLRTEFTSSAMNTILFN